MTTIYVDKDKELPERDINDVYETEENLVRLAFEYIPSANNQLPIRILDIGSGRGVWGKVAREIYPNAIIDGVEIRDIPTPEGYNSIYHGDFRQIKLDTQYNLVIGNPPYKYAEEVVRFGWDALDNGGFMVFLLRLAFQAGVGRYEGLWQHIYPFGVGVLSRRPSFYDGKTNGTDYALYYWAKRENGQPHGTPGKWGCYLVNYER